MVIICKETIETDRYRKESFEQTFPELFELLKPYWEKKKKKKKKAKSEFINEESKIFKLDTIIRNKGTDNDSVR